VVSDEGLVLQSHFVAVQDATPITRQGSTRRAESERTQVIRHRHGIGIGEVLFGEFGLFIHEGEDRKQEEVGGSGTQRGTASKKPTADLTPFLVLFRSAEELSHETDFQGQGSAGISAGTEL